MTIAMTILIILFIAQYIFYTKNQDIMAKVCMVYFRITNILYMKFYML